MTSKFLEKHIAALIIYALKYHEALQELEDYDLAIRSLLKLQDGETSSEYYEYANQYRKSWNTKWGFDGERTIKLLQRIYREHEEFIFKHQINLN